MTMERTEMLKKLGEIKALTANMVISFDMGIQFDVMTAKGVCTNYGNVGNWPCYKMPITTEFKLLKERLENGGNVSAEDILKVDVCKILLSYTDMLEGQSWLVEGDILNTCIENLKNAIITLDTNKNFFFAYVDLEDWGDNDIVFFNEYNELNRYFGEIFGSDYDLYEDMNDEDLERAYDEAEDNGWNGIYFKNYVNADNEK